MNRKKNQQHAQLPENSNCFMHTSSKSLTTRGRKGELHMNMI